MQSRGTPRTEADRGRAQVERILAGDETAFAEIDAAYRPRVRSFVTVARDLPPAHLEIFRLRSGDGFSIHSIAENVGKSNEAVKVSLRRSRQKRVEVVPELQLLRADAPLERPVRRLRKLSVEASSALRLGSPP
jgi:DNA-directed RNA polymerase specialized sigma24 family protein